MSDTESQDGHSMTDTHKRRLKAIRFSSLHTYVRISIVGAFLIGTTGLIIGAVGLDKALNAGSGKEGRLDSFTIGGLCPSLKLLDEFGYTWKKSEMEYFEVAKDTSKGYDAWAASLPVQDKAHKDVIPDALMVFSGYVFKHESKYVMTDRLDLELDQSARLSSITPRQQSSSKEGLEPTTLVKYFRYSVMSGTGRWAGAKFVDIYFNNDDWTRVVQVLGC